MSCRSSKNLHFFRVFLKNFDFSAIFDFFFQFSAVKSLWRPEYGAYMIEGTPGKPYGGLLAHFNVVEANMRYRRQEAVKELRDGEVLLSLTSFPRLGTPDFTEPASNPTPKDGATRSLFFPDKAIFQGHPRFETLTRNIRQRRGEKVAINIPSK